MTSRVAKYDLHAIPVVDDRRRLVGIITHDDVIDAVRQEATEDAQRARGRRAARRRLHADQPGHAVVEAGRVADRAVRHRRCSPPRPCSTTKGNSRKWTWLVIFIPLIMGSGGNTGNQSATLIITALTTGNVALRDWRTILWRELRVGLMLGGLLALLGPHPGLDSDAGTRRRRSSHALWPLVVPLTLVLVVTCGAVSGCVLPLIFKRIGPRPGPDEQPVRRRASATFWRSSSTCALRCRYWPRHRCASGLPAAGGGALLYGLDIGLHHDAARLEFEVVRLRTAFDVDFQVRARVVFGGNDLRPLLLARVFTGILKRSDSDERFTE